MDGAAEVEVFVDALVERRRDHPTAAALLAALGPGLVARGLPLWRLGSSIETLHPEVVATSTAWYRATGRAEATRWPREFARTVEDLNSPLRITFRDEIPWRRRLDDASPEAEAFPLLAEFRARGATDYLACPLRFASGPFNALTWTTDRPGGFTDDALAALERLTRRLAPVFEAQALREAQVTLLDTYVGRRSGRRILGDGWIGRGSGEAIEAVVWLCDLRGSTALAEALPRPEWLALLNAYFDRMTAAIEAHGGEVLKFIGDGVLALVPLAAATAAGRRETCRRALAAALDARAAIAGLNRERAAADRVSIGFGVALHLGEVIYGNVGAARRLDFTVVGPAVNLVSRIEALNPQLGRWLLTSAAFAAACAGCPLESLGAFGLRGTRATHELFTLATAADDASPHFSPGVGASGL